MLKPTHPGEILLEDVIKPLGLSIKEAADYLGVTRATLSRLINCRQSVTVEMALRLSKAIGRTSPEMWLNLQQKYDLWKSSKDALRTLENVRAFTPKKPLKV